MAEFMWMFPPMFPMPTGKSGVVVMGVLTAGAVVCAGAAVSQMNRNLPVPEVYRDTRDCRTRIKFRNVGGHSPMVLQSVHVVSHGVRHERLASAIGAPAGVALHEPSGRLVDRCRSHPRGDDDDDERDYKRDDKCDPARDAQHGDAARDRRRRKGGNSSSTLCTLWPTTPGDPEWPARVDRLLDSKDLRVVVDYRYFVLPGFRGFSATKECRV